MTVDTMELLELVRKAEDGQAGVDFLREGIKVLAEAVMDAEVSEQIGAQLGERAPDQRTTHRNGYRSRRWDTRVGSIDLQIPKVRQGSYFPSLLQPRRRAERALASVVMQCYVQGVSTRKVEDIAAQMGIESMSKSKVSEICGELDELVADWRTRPLDDGPYPFLCGHEHGLRSSCPYSWLDGLELKVREGGRVVSTHVLVATAVNADGRREIVGLKLGSAENGAAWTALLRDLVSRGLEGVRLVISDAHAGLVDAVNSVLDGAAWQRCKTHFIKNLLTAVPTHAQGMVKEAVKSIFTQSRPKDAWAQLDRVVDQLASSFPDAADKLEQAGSDILAYTAFPKKTWRRIWSNNPQERINREIRRRTDVVGIFPDRPSVVRLVGAVLAEQTDEWLVGRRYMALKLVRASLIDTTPETPPDLDEQELKQLQRVTA